MKLSDAAPVGGMGYREVLERETLARKAREAARDAATKRSEELRRALAGQAAPDVAFAAARILEIVEADPARFLDPKVYAPPVEPKKPPANMQRSPGMIGNNRATIALHLLAVTRLATLLGPLDDEAAGIVADAQRGYELLKKDIPGEDHSSD